MLEQAFLNWPEDADFQPDNREHLRAYLTVKAGHREILGERLQHNVGDPLRMVDFIGRVLTRVRDRGGYAFAVEHNEAIVVMLPRSIDWDTLDQQEFSPIATAIYAIIEQILKVSIEELKANA